MKSTTVKLSVKKSGISGKISVGGKNGFNAGLHVNKSGIGGHVSLLGHGASVNISWKGIKLNIH